VVPFNSIKSFFDPSVQFGLQFEPTEVAAEATAGATTSAETAASALAAPAAAPSEDEPAKPSEGAEVVRLDRFRKK
jgi:hypothetical protein